LRENQSNSIKKREKKREKKKERRYCEEENKKIAWNGLLESVQIKKKRQKLVAIIS
jgi:hypothetical protein